ncbi:Metallo-hydrolase/oxidoreductase [Aspergillus taichungensis]|uniref:Metallo-hydrolase/oxidoreductase n=1 Tax=Aspergillus taichungensis TaxID=482145 RepID=A0A2J5I7W3_9EURO|nr:Metallo-hydrolase/oxidoreductase [Aspergillus taichungensis]
MPSPTLTITHITTATAILNINGTTFLTDPFFGPVDGTEYDTTPVWEQADLQSLGLDSIPPPPHLINRRGPALQLDELPPIDAVLLSHEDHLDNLDPEGRKLLDARKVFTTPDGASNLRPRPGIVGLRPWETVTSTIGDKVFRITGTPCKHFPVGEVTGFILETDSLGVHAESGKLNAIYFSGDTVYIDELKEIGARWHVTAALLNLGKATFDFPVGPIQITMDGGQAVRLMREIGADLMIPVHFESWEHFTEDRDGLAKTLDPITLFHAPSSSTSTNAFNILKRASTAASSTARGDFQLEVTTAPPTTDQLRNILDYVSADASAASTSRNSRAYAPSDVIKGAKDAQDALKRFKEDGGAGFVRPITVDWTNAQAVIGDNESEILRMVHQTEEAK